MDKYFLKITTSLNIYVNKVNKSYGLPDQAIGNVVLMQNFRFCGNSKLGVEEHWSEDATEIS